MSTFLTYLIPLLGVGIVGHGLFQLRRERDAREFRRLLRDRKAEVERDARRRL
ncbi:hypothetical protein [uncultured Pseudomonas sp.]|uniref:hypothetical protein n=1 Tax=uncultured Pseudomonas sp. TaxID=114707 RepID=UPI00258B45D9|nr:hypothetical protein [uncultured Pseudomonas sp.]